MYATKIMTIKSSAVKLLSIPLSYPKAPEKGNAPRMAPASYSPFTNREILVSAIFRSDALVATQERI